MHTSVPCFEFSVWFDNNSVSAILLRLLPGGIFSSTGSCSLSVLDGVQEISFVLISAVSFETTALVVSSKLFGSESTLLNILQSASDSPNSEFIFLCADLCVNTDGGINFNVHLQGLSEAVVRAWK